MKKILSLILIVVLSSCDNGSSSSGNADNTSPGSSSEFSKIATGQLYKGNICGSVSPMSIRYYFKKLSSNSVSFEQDFFNQANCENNLSNTIDYSTRTVFSVNTETTHSVDSSFKVMSMSSVEYQIAPISQSQTDVFNNANYCSKVWVVGQFQDITNCDQQTQPGSFRQLVFKFQDNKILLYDGNFYE